MPSSYTPSDGFELIATGEQSGNWGATLDNQFSFIDYSLNGVLVTPLSTTSFTLQMTPMLASNSRNRVLVFTGTPSGPVTVTIAPNTIQKLYFVVNQTSQNLIFTQGNTTTVTVAPGLSKIVYADGAGTTAGVHEAYPINSDQVTEGTVHLFYTNARAQAAISAVSPIGYNSSNGQISFVGNSDNVPQGTTNLYYTSAAAQSDAKKAISVTGPILAYNSTTGVISTVGFTTDAVPEGATNKYYHTAQSQSDARSALSGAAPIVYNPGTGAISWNGNTSNVPEGANLYYSNARAQAAISVSGDLGYGGGVVSYSNWTTGWTAASSFYTNWVSQGLRFRKTSGNIVFLDGSAKWTGAANANSPAIFTLPAGYRPTGQKLFPLISESGSTVPAKTMVVQATGDVQVSGLMYANNEVVHFEVAVFTTD